MALEATTRRFAQVVWVPGNHELWATRAGEPRGEERYRALVELCRGFGVLTPEDPFPVWPGDRGLRIAPLFVGYDYSFRPSEVPLEGALRWAAEAGLRCADEDHLHPDPWPSREAWCAARCRASEQRLATASRDAELVIVNHFPLREDQVRLFRIPRFSIWCGTRATQDWHRRFRARVVVSGHLHVRATDWVDDVRFEEVSLGYPRQWRRETGLAGYLREILPGPRRWPHRAGPLFHR
jgi:3',5'-cyclic AMP phosphodiesterase CpdA